MPSYQPFVIRIGEPAGDAYPVTALFQGTERRGSIPVAALRLSEAELVRSASWLASDPRDRQAAADLGSRLFYALLPGDLLSMFREAVQRLGAGERLRILLVEPLPEPLGKLPWELVTLAQGEAPVLARSAAAPLARLLPATVFPNAAPRAGQLRVLAASAFAGDGDESGSPAGLRRGLGLRRAARLVWEHIRRPASLPDLARRLLQGRRYRVDVVAHATRERLAAQLRQAAEAGESYHAIHLACPSARGGDAAGRAGGEPDHEADVPSFVLEREDGGRDAVTAGDLAALAAGPSMNLLFLQLSGAAADDLAAATARAAVPGGLPAVVSMRAEAVGRAAVDYVREFYRAWAAGEPLETALAYAARLVRWLHPGDPPGPRSRPAQQAPRWGVPAVRVGGTGGVALPRLERVHVLPRGLRIFNWLLGTVLAVVGITTNVLNLPEFPRTVRTRAPVVRCLWPYPMNPNQFNVAFVPFTVVDATGAARWSLAGRAPAEFLYRRFAIDFEGLELKIPYELRPPDLACAIGGRTAEARASAAASLAERINADVLIYGTIEDGPSGDRLTLAFHVGYRGFEGAAEITGAHPLGGSLPIALPFDPEELLTIENPPHLVRMDVLSRMVVGLSFLATDNPQRALAYFRQAEENPHWPRVDGKEVVYMLIGNALLRQAALANAPGAALEAYEAYTTALSIDPGYVRARLGQAAALARIAYGDPATRAGGEVDWARLDQAEAAYRDVLEAVGDAGDARLEPGAHVGLGLIHLIRSISGSPGALEQAKEEFGWVVRRYESGDAGAAGNAGNAYGYLGGIARLEGNPALAADYYGRAIDLLQPVSRALYLTRLGDLHCQTGDLSAAVAAYDRAVDTARLYGYADSVDEYTARREALRAKGCP